MLGFGGADVYKTADSVLLYPVSPLAVHIGYEDIICAADVFIRFGHIRNNFVMMKAQNFSQVITYICIQ